MADAEQQQPPVEESATPMDASHPAPAEEPASVPAEEAPAEGQGGEEQAGTATTNEEAAAEALSGFTQAAPSGDSGAGGDEDASALTRGGDENMMNTDSPRQGESAADGDGFFGPPGDDEEGECTTGARTRITRSDACGAASAASPVGPRLRRCGVRGPV